MPQPPTVEFVTFHIAKSQLKDFCRGQEVEVTDPNHEPPLRKQKYTVLTIIPKRTKVKIVAFRPYHNHATQS